MNLELVSEDERRKLYEFGKGKEWKVAKYLVVKEYCQVGGHYHKNKDELFLIVEGHISYSLAHTDKKGNAIEVEYAAKGDCIYVPRNVYHNFRCQSGTVIIGLATELHDDSDDYKL